MTGKSPRNLPASVRQRLTELARARGEELQYLLTRYALERLLYRLSQSAHANEFILKGAALFPLWSGHPHRSTRDLDLLGHGEASTERLQEVFQAVCTADVEPDGLIYLSDSVRAEQIKEDEEYHGVRLRIDSRLGNARIPLQIDVGFGDAVTPGPVAITYPTLLDFPAPTLPAYPRETVVAEKLQAMVMLGIANSRMKDFYDLWFLSQRFAFDGATLCGAIRATFERRRTPLPNVTPLALTEEFSTDRTKTTQWTAFVRKSRLADPALTLSEVVAALEPFLMPPVRALVANVSYSDHWPTGGPWRPGTSESGNTP